MNPTLKERRRRRKISLSLFGHPSSVETRRKLSVAMTRRNLSGQSWLTPALIIRRNESIRAAWTSEKRRQAGLISSARHRNYEAKEKLRRSVSLGLKRYWSTITGESRITRLGNFIGAGPARCAALWSGTSIEVATQKLLSMLDIKCVPQKQIGPYFVDFYLPSYNLIIECDGEYWHSSAEAQTFDSIRDHYFRERGFGIVRLPEREIRVDNFDKLYSALGQNLSQREGERVDAEVA